MIHTENVSHTHQLSVYVKVLILSIKYSYSSCLWKQQNILWNFNSDSEGTWATGNIFSMSLDSVCFLASLGLIKKFSWMSRLIRVIFSLPPPNISFNFFDSFEKQSLKKQHYSFVFPLYLFSLKWQLNGNWNSLENYIYSSIFKYYHF